MHGFSFCARAALAAFVLAIAPARAESGPEAPATDSVAASPASELWGHRCAGCHGKDGSGPLHKRENLHIPDFRAPAWQAAHDDAHLAATIRDGIPEKRMPSFKSRLTSEQIDSLVALVRTFKA